MDIHKPKPVHSWAEFLSEIVVIVTGIVIALLGEQLVEAVHHMEERHELRAALERDSREALRDSRACVRFADEFIRYETDEISMIRRAVVTHLFSVVPAPKFDEADVVDDPAFKAATASGALTLLPQEEVLAYSEAHFGTLLIAKYYDATTGDFLKIRAFRHRFRRPDGAVDFSSATREELVEYERILEAAVWDMAACRRWN